MGDYGPGVLPPKTNITDIPPPPSTARDEISVLVTGFGPFKTNLVNASYLIASSLPSSFDFPLEASSEDGITTRRVSIHVHPTPIPVAYSTVQSTLPSIIEDYVRTHGGRRPDIVIHMGIAATRSYYSVETQAHRDSYHMSDIKGRAGYEDGERIWRDLGLPPVLRPGRGSTTTQMTSTSPSKQLLNPHPPDDDFLKSWKAFAAPGTDVRISHDAGRYLCEFIYYTSMALAFREGHDRNVVFFHVPAGCNDADVQKGRDAAIALIKALIQRWVDQSV
ncbi:peptidase C15, pyroglutamyl peptidase I-like protein [Aspergillus terreus]|uniref:Peptidase C15, pyroglutamyl peptidase I-like protein n=1 Tax=Aspergillus terreus TaxID=33178 RepID=A0A5M3Z8I6_ASPTE|nr:hypothetical protein ATETN484_0009022900 [Aspergillus terreus]GFF17680.1 peptidase C15, pyroglutamyl peptidase I-like protein [Aspergillus terreus]